jgi:hypothetical protein
MRRRAGPTRGWDGAGRVGVALFVAVVAACRARAPIGLVPARSGVDTPAVSPQPNHDPLATLRGFEDRARAQTDFAHPKTSDTAFGADPYVIRSVAPAAGASLDPGRATRFVGLLRGRSALVELDGSLQEVARLPAPESPTGLAVAANGELFVVGELANRVARYRRRASRDVRAAAATGPTPDGEFESAGSIELSGVRAMRDVATGPEGVVYVVEEHDGRLLTLKPEAASGVSSPAVRVDSTICHGPLHVMRVARAVLVDCLLDHAIVLRAVDARGFPVAEREMRIGHDGPMWGLDALDDRGGLLVAVGGVEDHPLDRTEGSFGFVDSFVTLYLVANGRVVKLSEVNTSALGIVTPKALKFSRNVRGTLELAVAGYGSNRLAWLAWEQKGEGESLRVVGEPTIRTLPIPPGSRTMELLPDGSLVVANPLLDAWVRATADQSAVVRVEDTLSSARSADSHLGEALFFTTLMAPWNKTDGRLSRFTCETCHFEGYVDGRTHNTGRGDVRATTKPLLGLLSNRPYFSRALDPDMTTMVDNEFGVAGANSGHDSWFSLSSGDFPWLKELSAQSPTSRGLAASAARADEAVMPQALRRALMTFLMEFTHRPNPSVVGRQHWTDSERRGAAVFRDKCEACHQARLVADDPSTRLGYETWEERVMARGGAIVWARAEHEKTGVVPYVNEKGARVVSLRRLYKKYPYFTNGSAKDIASVLDRVGLAAGVFFHDGAPVGADRLSDEEKAELTAFVDLL